MASQSHPSARFSTYSGAPSLQPSLAPTTETISSTRSCTQKPQRDTGQTTYLDPQITMNEKAQQAIYANANMSAIASTSTLSSTGDPKTADIKSWSRGFERMQDKRLEKQRYVMSGNKTEEVSKLALGAKLERALGRRMVGQDASFRKKVGGIESEKRSLEVQVQ